MTARVLGVIPARYGSQRLPGKPLLDIAGKPLIQRVWERARQVAGFEHLVIATDNQEIYQTASSFGAIVKLTSPTHASGSDRTAEVVHLLKERGHTYDFVVNIQGDLPFLNPIAVSKTIDGITSATSDFDIGTAASPIYDQTEFERSAVVKVVATSTGEALYFSRSPIPFNRDGDTRPLKEPLGWKHFGLYVFRTTSLLRMTSAPNSKLEQLERLEQLRALELGMRIHITFLSPELTEPSIEIDLPEDVARAIAYCRRNNC